jgi:hypothetical protein
MNKELQAEKRSTNGYDSRAVMTNSSAEGAASRRIGLTAEGVTAGIIGGATIAVWFLILDSVHGHPLYTPTLLGTAILRPGTPISPPEALPVSASVVLLFTVLHGVIFVGIGEIAALLVRLAEKNANYTFGVILFLVIFLSGFFFITMVFAAHVLDTLSWQAVFVGNLLAVCAMSLFFKRRHPNVKMLP